MADKIVKGDAVVLNTNVVVTHERDANSKNIIRAYASRDKADTRIICGSRVGFYLGSYHIPLFSFRMRTRARIETLLHAFLFKNNVVYVDPKNVDVIAPINEAKEIED